LASVTSLFFWHYLLNNFANCLKERYSLHDTSVLYKALPGFLMTIILALFKKGGKHSSLRLAFVRWVRALVTGSPRALRKLNGILLSFGAKVNK